MRRPGSRKISSFRRDGVVGIPWQDCGISGRGRGVVVFGRDVEGQVDQRRRRGLEKRDKTGSALEQAYYLVFGYSRRPVDLLSTG